MPPNLNSLDSTPTDMPPPTPIMQMLFVMLQPSPILSATLPNTINPSPESFARLL
jgi:hypothetical protein